MFDKVTRNYIIFSLITLLIVFILWYLGINPIEYLPIEIKATPFDTTNWS